MLCLGTVILSSTARAGTPAEAEQKQRQALVAKCQALLLSKVDFKEASAEEAVEFLRIKSREKDPRGVNIMLKLPEAEKAVLPKITLNLTDVPLSEALRYVAELSGLIVQVEPNAVALTSVTYASTTLNTRVFNVPPGFLKPTGSVK
jgi:general secretion pathway protein D